MATRAPSGLGSPVSPADTPDVEAMDRTVKAVRVGAALMNLIEPHPGHEIGYNRWYEEDHLYAVLQGPGAIAGARFVARHRDKARRRVAEGHDPARGSFFTMYWFDGDGRAHRAWRAEEGPRLEAAGRVYRQRDFVLGYDARLVFSATREPGGVPVELALDHRFPHAALTVIEPAEGLAAGAAAERYRDACVPLLQRPGSSVAVIAAFVAPRVTKPAEARTSDGEPGPEDLVVVWFCDVGLDEQWDDLADAQEQGAAATGLGRVVWESPFVGAVVGTDTYMDELSAPAR